MQFPAGSNHIAVTSMGFLHMRRICFRILIDKESLFRSIFLDHAQRSFHSNTICVTGQSNHFAILFNRRREAECTNSESNTICGKSQFF